MISHSTDDIINWQVHARYIAARDDAKTKLKESKQQVEAAEEPIKALFKDMEPACYVL